MHTEDIEYEVDGQRMVGRLAYDDGKAGRRPAVLISHEAPGVDDNVKNRAERLAALGYVAFALDYIGNGTPLPIEEVMVKLGPLMADPDRIRRLAKAGLDVLLADDAWPLRREVRTAVASRATPAELGSIDGRRAAVPA